MIKHTKGEVELVYQFGHRIVVKKTRRTIFRVTQNDGRGKPALPLSEVTANGEWLVRLWNNSL